MNRLIVCVLLSFLAFPLGASTNEKNLTVKGFSINCGDAEFSNIVRYSILNDPLSLIEVEQNAPDEGFSIVSNSFYFENGFNFQVYIRVGIPSGFGPEQFIRCPKGGMGSYEYSLDTKSKDGSKSYVLNFSMSINGSELAISDILITEKNKSTISSIIDLVLAD